MNLAEFSVDLVWAAATVLAIALVFFATDLARLTGGRAEAREAAARDAVAKEERLDDEEPDATAVSQREAAQRIAVEAAVGSRVGSERGDAGGSAGARSPEPAEPGPSQASRATPSEPGGVTGPASLGRKFANIGVSVSWLGTALLLAGIITRGVAAGRAPWANMYEFTLVGSLVAMAVFLVVNIRRDVRFLGSFVTGIVLLFLVLAQNEFYIAATGVQPALQDYWLIIHVGIAISATGVFTVAFVTSVLQLASDSRENGNPYFGRRGLRWLDAVPGARQLEALSFRLNAVGFVLWTFTLISGAIWAEHAWDRYWGWDPKEVWSFIVWVVYAAYLHARTTRGWSGRRAAYFVIVGYACVLFNFTGVNLIFHGKHSYSGLTG